MRKKHFDDFDEGDDDEQEPEQDPEVLAMLESLRDYLRNYYAPVFDPAEAEFHFTTRQVWEQLLNIYPNEIILTPALVSTWLSALNFQFYDYGEMKLEWMMKRR